MKTKIAITKANGGHVSVEAMIIKHPTLGDIGIHRSLEGRSWSATHARTGRRITQQQTRAGAVAWVKSLTPSPEQLALVEAMPDAPDPRTLDPAPSTPKPETGGKARHAAVVAAVVDELEREGVPLTDEERDAIGKALSTRTGILKLHAPEEPLAQAAWNGIQPNGWKIQVGALMFMPDNARAFFDRVSKHRWPAILDKDLDSLRRMGVA